MFYVAHSRSSIEVTTHNIGEGVYDEAIILADTHCCQVELRNSLRRAHISTATCSALPGSPIYAVWKSPSDSTAGKFLARISETSLFRWKLVRPQHLRPRDVGLNESGKTIHDENQQESHRNGSSDRVWPS